MNKATSKRRLDGSRLMVLPREVNGTEQIFGQVGDLGLHVGAKDLLVMNSSATLPASFQISPDCEIRLAAYAGNSLRHGLRDWWAVVFGAGDWRRPTEERGPASRLRAGQALQPGLRVIEISERQPRLIKVRFEGADYLSRIYRDGKPIQYAYHQAPLALWDVQTLIGGIPLSVEPPSALIPLQWRRLFAQMAETAFVLHGAGLSSTGDVALDAMLPLPEYFQVPKATTEAIARTKARGGRVIAIGTSATRALESAARLGGAVHEGVTDLRLSAANPARCIDGILTGYHDPSTSHFQLEESLLPRFQLETAFRAAEAEGCVGHEFGDAVLIA